MKFLIDTNIFLEVILEQEKAVDARQVLSKTEKYEFYISDVSFDADFDRTEKGRKTPENILL